MGQSKPRQADQASRHSQVLAAAIAAGEVLGGSGRLLAGDCSDGYHGRAAGSAALGSCWSRELVRRRRGRTGEGTGATATAGTSDSLLDCSSTRHTQQLTPGPAPTSGGRDMTTSFKLASQLATRAMDATCPLQSEVPCS